MGPAVLARALDGVPYAVKVHGSALEYTVKPHPERFLPYAREGLAPAQGRARRLAPHRREPVGGDGRPRPRGPHEARPAGRRHRRVHARGSPTRRGRGLEALVRRLRDDGGGRGRLLLRARPRGGRRGARRHRARGPPRRLRRQADRLQGRRPAARRLAARAGARAGGQARGRRLRGVPRGARAPGRGPGGRRPRRRPRDARRERAGAEVPRAFLDDAPDGYGARPRPRRVGRPARPRRARRPAARHRGDGRPEHVPRGVRDGRRRGRGLRLAARGGAPLRARRGRGDARRRPSRRRRGRCWPSSAAPARCGSWRPPWPAGWRRPRTLRAATREAMVAITRERYSWDGVARTLVAAAEGRLDGLPAP